MNISYIVPAYNSSKTILESLNSIKQNISLNDEIVIVNDASTDNTLILVSDWISKNSDLNINLINHQINLGGGSARNTAVLNAKNDLIFCLDSDNILLPNSVEKLKCFLVENDYDIVCFERITYFLESSVDLITHEWVFDKIYYDFKSCISMVKVPPASGNYLYKKETWNIVKGYPDYSGALDAWGFGIKQCANGYKIYPLPDSNYLHRHGNESYWIREEKSGTTSLNAFRILLEFRNKFNFFDIIRISTFNSKYWHSQLDLYPIYLKNDNLILKLMYLIRFSIQLIASIVVFHKFYNRFKIILKKI